MSGKWTFKNTKISIENGRLLNGRFLSTPHPDVNGVWGGDETWFIEIDANSYLDKKVRLIYALVGDYLDVCFASHIKAPSSLETVQTLTCALRDGVSPALLMMKIKEAINGECVVCGNPVINTHQEPALCAYHDTPPDGI